VGTQKDFNNGSVQTTNQPLDVAVIGNGFLQVQRGDGETAYTRAGQLQVDSNGRVVNAQGLPLVPAITVPAKTTALTISDTGMVQATIAGSTAPQDLGQITLASFVNPPGLLALGDNLYQETAASGTPTEAKPGDNGLGHVKQGALEGSNVQVVEEMVDMIAAQRSYEMNTKVLSAADNMLQYLAQAAPLMRRLLATFGAIVAALVSGCAAIEPPPVRPPALDEPQPVAKAPAQRGHGGGVFVRDAAWSLTSDSPAFRAGDVVTVVLDETDAGEQEGRHQLRQGRKRRRCSRSPSRARCSRPTSASGAIATSTAAPRARSRTRCRAPITVVVQEVLPNGLLRIAGDKTLTLNQGEEFIRLRGFVRAADIDADNRVSSQRIADARIAYSGQGSLATRTAPAG
jgi:flagellar basal-body rod protein FlgG